MILVDTSVWVDHLSRGDAAMAELLESGTVWGHSWVTGEIAMGNLPDRAAVLGSLARLPQAPVAASREVHELIERHRLFGRGLSWIDVHLIASTLLSPGATLWTRDRRLALAAEELGIAAANG